MSENVEATQKTQATVSLSEPVFPPELFGIWGPRLNDGKGDWLFVGENFGLCSTPYLAFKSYEEASRALEKIKESDRDSGIKDPVYEIHSFYEGDEGDDVDIREERRRFDATTSTGPASIPIPVAAEETSSDDETTADDVLEAELPPPPATGKKGRK